MKKLIPFVAVILLMSCNTKSPEAIKKQIESKKAKISAIEEEISKLEIELATLDTNKKNKDLQLIAVEEVKAETFEHFIEVQGSLDGDNNVAVFPEGMGVIDAIYVKIGQKVSKGQILAKMNDAAYVEQIKGLKTNLELATTMYERQKSLWDQNIGSEVQYLQAKSTKETLESQLAAAERQLEMMQIKSPISGTIEDLSIKIGQSASPQFPACRVVNFGQIKVVTDVAEAYASKIKVGDNIDVYLPDIDKTLKANVNFASNFINQVNRTFRVEAMLRELDPGMKANMIVVLKINDYKKENAIILPVNYVQKDQNSNFVYVARQNGDELKAVKQVVTTGQIYNGMAEITSGLNVGDKLITLGYLEVEDGENVRL